MSTFDVMAGARLAKLERLVSVVDELASHARPETALEHLETNEGAGVAFRGGTYMLTLGGVRGTCTAGGRGVLESWLRAARKRLGEQVQ